MTTIVLRDAEEGSRFVDQPKVSGTENHYKTAGLSQIEPLSEKLNSQINTACARIAPLWPLKHFVAVNPFLGLTDLSFQEASDNLARILGHGLYMNHDYYRAQISSGRISHADIEQAINLCNSQLNVRSVTEALAKPAPQPKTGMVPVSEILEWVEGGLWSSFVTERISLHCAAYFDLGQAVIGLPWKNQSLYDAWKKSAALDRSPSMMGLGKFRHAVSKLPHTPQAAISFAIEHLEIPEEAIERYLHASLLSIGGWAAWARYLRWQAELTGEKNDAIVDLLAIRLSWDVLLYQEKNSAALVARWREMLANSMRPPSSKRQDSAEIDRIMLQAMEIGLQRDVISRFNNAGQKIQPPSRPALQAAFCIDVRSEVFRRSLETVAPNAETLGFAGFFGIFIEHIPLGADNGRSHVPVIFTPSHRICEQFSDDRTENSNAVHKRRERIGLFKTWKGFKFSASSCFSFVEASGLLYAPKLLTDSFGWSRPVPDPLTQGLEKSSYAHLKPSLRYHYHDDGCANDACTGIPQDEQLDHAERILRAMTLTDNFARIVLLVGHGSSSVNNPHATGLDCGACAGQTGETSARVVAALMNDLAIRNGLKQRGIHIPGDTWFLAALHDTTTDDVKLFDTRDIPEALEDDLAQLEQWLTQAGDLTRLQRANNLGLSDQPDQQLKISILKRSKDWSQVRPEWALANNAAFIAAPRGRTLGGNLDGRAFLHEYKWHDDTHFKTLELIMTAPMIVANWINMQYYGSVVNNEKFGSGNKVLHNIVGGAIGVLEGNGGDLRVGLPMQSLHNGKTWVHEPLRLSVFIEAPESSIDDIIKRHDLVRQLIDNQWLHMFNIDDNGQVNRRIASGNWHAV